MCAMLYSSNPDRQWTNVRGVQANRPLFNLGTVVATRPVLTHIEKAGVNAQLYLDRHASGDWGEVPPDDAQANRLAVERGSRVLSAYEIAGERVWIITEADRSITTMLFPTEY